MRKIIKTVKLFYNNMTLIEKALMLLLVFNVAVSRADGLEVFLGVAMTILITDSVISRIINNKKTK
jgi:hypothetical protein